MKSKLKVLFPFFIFVMLVITSGFYIFLIQTSAKNSLPSSNVYNDNQKIAYLTFDDGPSTNSESILQVLKTYNIKATFFVVGPSYKLKNDLLKKIVDEGHELAIHSYEHNYNYIYSSKENYLKDFDICRNWIKEITGKEPTLYRFPGGSSNTIASKSLIKSIISEQNSKGFIHADWNVDTLDSYVKSDYRKIVSNALTALKRNENNNHYYQTVLLHDDSKKNSTIKALPILIERIISMGYIFESLTPKSHIIKHVK